MERRTRRVNRETSHKKEQGKGMESRAGQDKRRKGGLIPALKAHMTALVFMLCSPGTPV